MNLVQLNFSYSFSDILHSIHSEVIVSAERQMALRYTLVFGFQMVLFGDFKLLN